MRPWSYWDTGLEKLYEQQAQALPMSADQLDLDLDTFLETATMRTTYSEEIRTLIKTVSSLQVAQYATSEVAVRVPTTKNAQLLDRAVAWALEEFVAVSPLCVRTRSVLCSLCVL